MTVTIKRPPLSAMMHHPVEEIERLGLKVEGSQTADLDQMRPYESVLLTAHGPYTDTGLRLNPAATDREFREHSIRVIEAYIDMTAAFPNLTQINIHFGHIRRLEEDQTRGREGDYGLQVEAFRRIADFAAARGKEIVLENSGATWSAVPADTPYDRVDWSRQSASFGIDPQEWVRVCEDVDRPNVGLCLDTSHACTHAHRFPEEQRPDVLFSFLERPDLIRHVHWSDNYLYDVRGRTDSHEILGRGTEPVEFHRAVKGLDAIILLETKCTVEELEEQLAFIDTL